MTAVAVGDRGRDEEKLQPMAGEMILLITADKRLIRAARSEEVAVVDPEIVGLEELRARIESRCAEGLLGLRGQVSWEGDVDQLRRAR